jgi:RNA polymerase sigma-70 factor (ECF subfamily)
MRDLVQRAQDGDLEAFRELYRENAGRVYAVCLRMAADAGRAEELTQEVFVRAWKKLGHFRGESAVASWLHRVAVNVVLESWRSEQRREARVQAAGDLSQLAGIPSPGLAPEERIDLERAIASLPPGARMVYVLHDVEGYRHREIAKLTGSAVGTSKAQLHRARRLLMEALER